MSSGVTAGPRSREGSLTIVCSARSIFAGWFDDRSWVHPAFSVT